MNDLSVKLFKDNRPSRSIKLGDVVTLCAREKFTKGKTGWGTVIEIIERGVAGTIYLCGVQWFNRAPHTMGSISYHYDKDLMHVEEKLMFDSHVYDSADDIPRNK